MKKKWYKSKTLWVNGLTFVASAGTIVSNFAGIISPVHYAIAISLVAAANIGLRLVTNEGVEV